jgi:hypothetical protein
VHHFVIYSSLVRKLLGLGFIYSSPLIFFFLTENLEYEFTVISLDGKYLNFEACSQEVKLGFHRYTFCIYKKYEKTSKPSFFGYFDILFLNYLITYEDITIIILIFRKEIIGCKQLNNKY